MAAFTAAGRPALAIIGGSGLYALAEEGLADTLQVPTPYADTPVTLSLERTENGEVWFLPRHGRTHSLAPHLINYRANLWALHSVGVRRIVAVNAVGGIAQQLEPGALVLPDQLIDYSWGRQHTFHDAEHALDKHCDFTWPYNMALTAALCSTAAELGLALQQGGVYACTQGPRLETAAEVRRLARDGCDLVGMTGMPEAVLARELDIAYSCLALVVNRAAGLGEGAITTAQIQAVLHRGIATARRLLLAALPRLSV